jgi:hypothetical protein
MILGPVSIVSIILSGQHFPDMLLEASCSSTNLVNIIMGSALRFISLNL